MRDEIVSIISEGVEDQGVLKTMLRAYGFDGSEIRYIRPELSRDATDNHNALQEIGTLQGVKNSCKGDDGKRPDFERALAFDNCNNIIIHIDTAELEVQNFNFTKPVKNPNPDYSTQLRERVIQLIDGWLDNEYKENILYAIAIEEIEAWCLTYFEKTETALSANPKGKLAGYTEKKGLTYKKLKLHPVKQKREYFETITKKMKFGKKKQLKKFAQKNESLNSFVFSLDERFVG